MNNRAQVTIYIVLALVLLGVVGIIFSLADNLKSDKISTQVVQNDRAKFDSAVKIIRDCITTSTQKSIVTIAQQGGDLFDNQGGPDSSTNAVPIGIEPTRTIFISKGIVRRTDEMGYPTQIQFSPGDVRSAPIDPLQNQQVRTLGGSVNLPKLCDRFGPNNPANPDVILTCEISSYGYDKKTIQNKIATFIQKKTIECAQDNSIILSQIGNDVSTYFGNLPEVIFGNDDITVSYVFDTNVSVSRTNFSHHETTIRVPARYKRLYNFLYAVLDKDSKDISFDKTSDYMNVNSCNYPGSSACWSEGFTISVNYGKYIDPSNGKLYDLVTARDEKSSIGGEPLEFNTVVENRRPVLVPMYNLLSFPSATYHPDDDWRREYDLYVKIGSEVLLQPYAYDFDEEDVRYRYSGWKATSDSEFDTGTSLNPSGCTEFSPLKCKYWDESYLSAVSAPARNMWEDSLTFSDGSLCYGSMSRCASYMTDDDGIDLGPHVVQITATDRAGLSDYVKTAVLVGTD